MKIKKRLTAVAEVPTCSTGDIAFLLLIFFLSTTKFDIKKGLGMVLPPPSQEGVTKKVRLKNDNLTKIMINANGQIAVNERVISLESLENQVRGIVRANPKMVFVLQTDRMSEYGNMVQVLDKLRLGGAEKINLSTN